MFWRILENFSLCFGFFLSLLSRFTIKTLLSMQLNSIKRTTVRYFHLILTYLSLFRSVIVEFLFETEQLFPKTLLYNFVFHFFTSSDVHSLSSLLINNPMRDSLLRCNLLFRSSLLQFVNKMNFPENKSCD